MQRSFTFRKKLEPGKRELDMAKALVDSMSSKWEPKNITMIIAKH
jgi:non-homologous end joining protein Ku